MKKVYFNPEEESFIKENYAERGGPFCVESLNGKFLLSQIHHFARKNNLKRIVTKKFDVNTLKIVDRPETAYYLGLLWADGHVSKEGESITIKVVEDDGLHFLSFIKSLGEFSVYSYSAKNRARRHMTIGIFNKDIGSYLLSMDFGNKSQATPNKILSTIPNEFKSYFWLGFFDGDGSIYSQGNGFHITFSGSHEQDWTDLYLTLEALGCKFKLKQYKNKEFGHQSSAVRMSHAEDVEKFCEYIYSNYDKGGIGLPRKRSRYEEFKKIVEARPKKKNQYRGVQGIPSRLGGFSSFFYKVNHNGMSFTGYEFTTAEDAAIAYDKKAIELKGESARTNFPITNYIELGKSISGKYD